MVSIQFRQTRRSDGQAKLILLAMPDSPARWSNRRRAAHSAVRVRRRTRMMTPALRFAFGEPQKILAIAGDHNPLFLHGVVARREIIRCFGQ
jgi:hypothetical protein